MEEFLEQLENRMIAAQVSKYIQEQKYTQALNFVWPLALKDKENTELYTLLGIIYCHANENTHAKAQLINVLKKKPEEFLPRYYLARVFVQEEKYENALMELEELLSQGHEDERVYQGIAALRKKLDGQHFI